MDKQTQEAQELTGIYYYFDCMNAVLTDRYFEAGAFENEAEAKRTAADYEAELYRCTFENGELVKQECIYDPFSCFDD